MILAFFSPHDQLLVITCADDKTVKVGFINVCLRFGIYFVAKDCLLLKAMKLLSILSVLIPKKRATLGIDVVVVVMFLF